MKTSPLYARAGLAALLALLWACNLSEAPRPTLLSLRLDDSLATYDSIRVDILYPNGKTFKEAAFHGHYTPGKDHALDDLDLGSDAPSLYQVLITAYRDTARALVFAVKVGPNGPEAPQVLVRGVQDDTGSHGPGVTPPLRVAMLTPSPLFLATESQAMQAHAEAQPKGADAALLWSSSDSSVVGVDGGGMLFPGIPGEADVTARSRRDPSLSAVLHVKVSSTLKARGLTLAPTQAVLYVGGPSLPLDAKATPEGSQASLIFASLNEAVARVSADGVVTAVAEGSADVNVFIEGEASLALACHVVVKRDVPVLEVGADRSARPGDTVSFPIKVTQDYGSVAVLKWDLDGDGKWDDSTAQGTAAPRRAYDGKDSLVTAIFSVRDSEGNVAQAYVLVHVGMGSRVAPPAFGAGTTASPTANPRPTWAWAGAPGGTGRFRISLDGGPERETRATAFTADSLRDGGHTLVLRELDAFGSSSPSVERAIRVLTAGPKVAILSPARGTLTNAAFIEVIWTEQSPGGSVAQHSDGEDLSGMQGRIVIVRSARDSLGGLGADTVFVLRDTIAPAAPAFTEASSPAVVNAAYAGPVQWTWTSAGDAGDRFLVSLNGTAAAEQSGPTFVLAAPQNQIYYLQVRETDSAGNVSPPVIRSIQVDRIAPPPPAVSGAYGAGPAWNWSPGSGSDGSRIFRYRLSTQTDWSPETQAVAYVPAGLPAGTYTLQVEEKDMAGNWSDPGTLTLKP